MTDQKAAALPLPRPDVAQPLSRGRRVAAWCVALLADAVQIAVVPLFGEGNASPTNVVLDLAVGVALTSLIGFHWSFVPSFVVESLPIADLAPTWTGAVFLATRRKKS